MSTSIEALPAKEKIHKHTPKGVALVVLGHARLRKYQSMAIGRAFHPIDTPLRKITLTDKHAPALLTTAELAEFCELEGLVTFSDVIGALSAILEEDCNEMGAIPVVTADPQDWQVIATFH